MMAPLSFWSAWPPRARERGDGFLWKCSNQKRTNVLSSSLSRVIWADTDNFPVNGMTRLPSVTVVGGANTDSSLLQCVTFPSAHVNWNGEIDTGLKINVFKFCNERLQTKIDTIQSLSCLKLKIANERLIQIYSAWFKQLCMGIMTICMEMAQEFWYFHILNITTVSNTPGP